MERLFALEFCSINREKGNGVSCDFILFSFTTLRFGLFFVLLQFVKLKLYSNIPSAAKYLLPPPPQSVADFAKRISCFI